MHTISILILSIVLTVSVRCQTTVYNYDCRRLDDCKNGGTCEYYASGANPVGTCTCAAGFEGYNCQIIQGTTCTNASVCQNNAVCYVDGGIDTCGCQFGNIGQYCEREYVTIDCSGAAIQFDFYFPEEFDGIVKLDEDDLSVLPIPPECAVTEAPDSLAGYKNYSLSITVGQDTVAGTSCGQEQLLEGTDNGNTVYTGRLRVQYMKTLVTSLDELYNLTCTHKGEGVEVSKTITNVNINTVGNLTVVGKNKTYSPVRFEILDKDGVELAPGAILYIGDEFMLHLYLTDMVVYKDLLIVSCNTNNTLENDPKYYQIFDKGCPTKAGKRIASEQVERERDIDGTLNKGKSISVEAFKFVDSDNIGIVCQVKICKDGDTSCVIPTDCDAVRAQADAPPAGNGGGGAPPAGNGGGNAPVTQPPATATQPAGRKRRAADTEGDQATVSKTITVRGPRDYTSPSDTDTQTGDIVESCLARSEILAVILVLGSVVMVLLIACFILACCLIKRRNSKSNVFEPSNNYQMRTDRFHLPRAHVNEAYREI